MIDYKEATDLVAAGELNQLKLLLDALPNFDINKLVPHPYDPASKRTLLSFAMITANDTAIAKYLLEEKHADPNIPDSEGNTPLIIAAISDNEAGVKLLLKYGADPGYVDRYGDSAITLANLDSIEKILRQAFQSGRHNVVNTSEKEVQALLEQDNCNLDMLLHGLKILSATEKASASDSVILLGKLKLPSGKTQEVAVKVTGTSREWNDNTLEVERAIYKNIISNLLVNNHTPHLISYLGSYTCKRSTLELSAKDQDTMDEALDKIGEEDAFDIDNLNLLFMAKSSGKPMRQFFADDMPTLTDSLSILVQMLYNLTCFSHIHLKHNDLHDVNTFIEKLPSPEVIYYGNGPNKDKSSKYIRLETNIIAKTYDWDRGSVYYNPSVPRNSGLDYSYCLDYGTCNGPSGSKFDLFEVLAIFHQFLWRDKPYKAELKAKFLQKVMDLFWYNEWLVKKYAADLPTHRLDYNQNPTDAQLQPPRRCLQLLVKETAWSEKCPYTTVKNLPDILDGKVYYPPEVVAPKTWQPMSTGTHPTTLVFDIDPVSGKSVGGIATVLLATVFTPTNLETIKIGYILRYKRKPRYRLWDDECKLFGYDWDAVTIDLFTKYSAKKFSTSTMPVFPIFTLAIMLLANPIYHKISDDEKAGIMMDYIKEVGVSVEDCINDIWNVFGNQLPITMPLL